MNKNTKTKPTFGLNSPAPTSDRTQNLGIGPDQEPNPAPWRFWGTGRRSDGRSHVGRACLPLSTGALQAGPGEGRGGGAADASAAGGLQGGEAEGHQDLGRPATATRRARGRGRRRQGRGAGAARQEPLLSRDRRAWLPARARRRVRPRRPGSDRVAGQHEGGQQARGGGGGGGGRGGAGFPRRGQIRVRLHLLPVSASRGWACGAHPRAPAVSGAPRQPAGKGPASHHPGDAGGGAVTEMQRETGGGGRPVMGGHQAAAGPAGIRRESAQLDPRS